jgi:hypothetical protein
MNRWSFQKMTGDKNQLDKKSRAGLTLPGGHQIKEAWAFDHMAWFLGISRIPHFPHLRGRDVNAHRCGPLNKKRIGHAN